ncbi:MAG: MFS transporter [Myxococcota bacterium]|nr:MFS transporter [Myxococcota bacterium]
MRKVSERAVVFLIGAVQFVNITDFVMVMPLGPDFARALDIPTSQLGVIGASYTWAASLAGLAGSFFLDRFDRRKVLALAMLGLVVGTVAGGFATSLTTLVLARVFAGAFGGPATSISLSIIADVVPPERRGRAMGAVFTAFSIASVLGVPAALYVAQLGGWRIPFFLVGGIGFLLMALAILLLPPMTGHLAGLRDAQATGYGFLRRPLVWLSYSLTFVTMASGFVLIPNISAYVQQNLGYPREKIALLYAVGGVASFIVLRLGGLLVDLWGSFKVGSFGIFAFVASVYVGFVDYRGLPVLLLFVLFMGSTGFRNVAYNTLASKVPRPPERARFMSLQSSVQHLAAGLGAYLSSVILIEAHGVLVHVDQLAWITIGSSLAIPVLLFLVERRVRANSAVPAPAG